MEFPRYFIFGRRYAPGDDYVRCDDPQKSFVVVPGFGEATATHELALSKCLSFVQRGTMSEASKETMARPPGSDNQQPMVAETRPEPRPDPRRSDWPIQR
ncbi:MAG TPA: hypothetical protein VGJ04_08820 [Pirellulales bacterium]|jgi:hypothetical protein